MKKSSTTLTDLFKSQKSRIGRSDGVTARGAYWLGFDLYINKWGAFRGAPPLCDLSFQIRHYRSGEVEFGLLYNEWNQVRQVEIILWYPLDIADATTIGEVYAAISQSEDRMEDLGGRQAIGAEYEESFEKELLILGLEDQPNICN